MYTYRILTPTYFAKNEYEYGVPRNLITPFLLSGKELIVNGKDVVIRTSDYSRHTISGHRMCAIEEDRDLMVIEIKLIPSLEDLVDIDVSFVIQEQRPLSIIELSDDDLPF